MDGIGMKSNILTPLFSPFLFAIYTCRWDLSTIENGFVYCRFRSKSDNVRQGSWLGQSLSFLPRWVCTGSAAHCYTIVSCGIFITFVHSTREIGIFSALYCNGHWDNATSGLCCCRSNIQWSLSL